MSYQTVHREKKLTMRLTGPQIAAAIALSGMTQEMLASEAKLGRNTLTQIIKGDGAYREDTIRRICNVLEMRGIEFTDQNGVRQKSQGVDMLTGSKGLQQFFDGVYEHMRQNGGTIVQFGVDEKQFLEHLGKEFSASYVKRMTDLSKERKDLNVRAIVCADDTSLLASDYNEYRWISKDIFEAVPFYIYGQTLAVMDFQTVPAPTIVLLKFPAITNAYRKQFEAFWKIAREMPEIAHQTKGG
jgi:transcriptional regulator with XRE-family HTH domain